MTASHRVTATFIVASLLALFSNSCTHNPITNKPIADTFEGCMGVNTATAGVIGVLIAQVTGNKKAGVAAALGTMLVAWHRCGQVHQKVVNTEVKSREDMQSGGEKGPALRIDQLTLTAGQPGEDIHSVVRYTVLANDPTKKDIPVKETRIIRLPKVTDDAQGVLVYANANGQPLLAGGRAIPVEGNTHPSPDSLVYRDYDYPVDNVIKQGMREAGGDLQTVKEMPAGMPYRFRFVVEAEGMRTEKEVEYHLSKPGRPAATFTAHGAHSSSAPTPSATPRENQAVKHAAETPSEDAGAWSGSAKKMASLRDVPGGKAIGQVSPGTLLVVVEDAGDGAKDVKTSGWVRVRSESGATGWLRKSEIKGLK